MSEQWVCSVCGYVHSGGVPAGACPVCGSPFTAFELRDQDPAGRFRGVTVAAPRPPGFRYVIIGNSAAGRSAATAMEAIDPAGVVTLISDEEPDLYARPMLPDLLIGAGRALLFAAGGAFPTARAEKLLGDPVTSLDVAAKHVLLASGRVVPYDALLLATGSTPIAAAWPGSEAGGIASFRTLADAERVLPWVETATTAVVVGGGLLGLEFVRAFLSRGLRVTQLVRDTRVGGPAVDDTASGLIASALAALGVEVLLGDEVDHFEQADARVEVVVTKRGRRLGADLVGVAIGVRPRAELAHAAGLEIDRGILVDHRFRTSAPDIYAAGDVAQAYDCSWGERRVNTSWRNARQQGEHAGLFMAGAAGAYPGACAINYQLAAGLPFCSMGLANPPHGQGLTIESAADPTARTYRKLVRRKTDLVGACLVGDLEEAPALERLLRGADRP